MNLLAKSSMILAICIMYTTKNELEIRIIQEIRRQTAYNVMYFVVIDTNFK